MAALQGADGAFLLGEMAPHTFSAGQIDFPAGTPDPSDVFDGAVDLDASARRELLEETDVEAAETAVRRGWSVVFSPSRVACMKLMTLAVDAEEAKARNDAFLAMDRHAEFTRMHVVRGLDDIDQRRMPASWRPTSAPPSRGKAPRDSSGSRDASPRRRSSLSPGRHDRPSTHLPPRRFRA